MTKPNHRRVHVLVSGQVQGVGYRISTAQAAEALGVQGWVRNLPDDRVETVFEGTPDSVEEMIRWCHRGPRAAVVTEVVVTDEELENLQGFYVRR